MMLCLTVRCEYRSTVQVVVVFGLLMVIVWDSAHSSFKVLEVCLLCLIYSVY